METNGPTKESLLKRAKLFLEDGNFAEAVQYAEKILDIDPECAEAYLIKAQAAFKVKETEQLAKCQKLGDNADFQKAIRFAPFAQAEEFKGWVESRKALEAQKSAAGKKKLKSILCIALALLLVAGSVFFISGKIRKPGNTVTFGTYGGEKIKWIILEKYEDGTYLLLSEKGLDAKQYNTTDTDITWEKCTLRKWLNGEFLNSAFTASERGKIVLSKVTNPDNKKYGTAGGKDTEDYVYLLSLDEVGQYFKVDPYNVEKSEALICMPTDTAVKNGAFTLSQAEANKYQADYSYPLKAGACWWWLRSPGRSSIGAALVNFSGYVFSSGSYVSYTDGCVRPVVRARL